MHLQVPCLTFQPFTLYWLQSDLFLYAIYLQYREGCFSRPIARNMSIIKFQFQNRKGEGVFQFPVMLQPIMNSFLNTAGLKEFCTSTIRETYSKPLHWLSVCFLWSAVQPHVKMLTGNNQSSAADKEMDIIVIKPQIWYAMHLCKCEMLSCASKLIKVRYGKNPEEMLAKKWNQSGIHPLWMFLFIVHLIHWEVGKCLPVKWLPWLKRCPERRGRSKDKQYWINVWFF